MDLLVDIGLLFILLVGVYLGYNKGLFIMVAKPSRTIISLFFAFCLCVRISDAVVYPLINKSDLINTAPDFVINIVARAVAFTVAFLALKFILGRIIAFICRIMDKGILGIINRSGGAALSGCIAFILASLAALAIQSLIYTDALVESEMTRSFGSGGYLYRTLININPIWQDFRFLSDNFDF
ncbi:MAG: CvpA family protein [Clostridia bacterium]|nr:CvpA family protein [Clostridia bacterium]